MSAHPRPICIAEIVTRLETELIRLTHERERLLQRIETLEAELEATVDRTRREPRRARR